MFDHTKDRYQKNSLSWLGAGILTFLEDLLTVDGLIPVITDGSIIDGSNSSTANLGNGGVFPGVFRDSTGYSAIIVSVIADQVSAIDGLEIQWSADGVTQHDNDEFTIPANNGKTFNFQPAWQYYRVSYTNGATPQTDFVLQTQLKKMPVRGSAHRLGDNVSLEDDAELVKGLIAGESDINQDVENVKTYRQALQVDPALVHRIGISEHAKLNLDGSTTLNIAASIGDLLINVAATAGFAVGSLVTINGTANERSHFHILVVNAGVSLELDRPLDNDHPIGTAVQEVDIGMNVAGTLADPISFKVQSPTDERWQITRILITMLDQTAMDDSKFGGINALVNGVVLRLFVGGEFQTLTHWKSNADLKDDMYNVEYSDKAPAGFFGLNGRWTWTAAEFVADLDGATSDYFEVLIQDDLTDLDDFEIKAQGRLFGG